MQSPSQDELLAFLRRPDSYPELPAAVEIKQTHISIVAITPTHAYKVKKPLDLGFLDFSTIEKRRAACEAEVRLNRRLTQDVYLNVVPISRREGALCFGDKGEVIEYAVKMRRLPDEGFLTWRLSRNAVTPADLGRVAAKLSGFYRTQQPSSAIAEWGRKDRLCVSTEENFAQTEQFVGTLISRPAFEAIRYFTELFYQRHASLLERRCAEGRILDCHGDLRSEHVHFSDAQINIFDCIEFNDRLRYIDVASDAAFLAMDLDFRRRPDLATRFLDDVARALDDAELLALADFYKCYRAYVRGKVSAIKTGESEVPAAEREESREQAGKFFCLALRYAIAGSEPMVLAVTGRVGTGKSSLAQMLGRALGAEVFSSDRIRKELGNVDPHTRGNAAARAQLYSSTMTDRTYDALVNSAMARSRSDRIAILDATFGKSAQRQMLRERLAPAGIRYRMIELRAADELIKTRLRQRDASTTEISDARLEDFAMLNTAYTSEDPVESVTHAVVESVVTVEATATEALKALVRLNVREAGCR